MSTTEETAGKEKETSQYNKLRTEEYSHLRNRFYAKYPIDHDCDFTFEDVIFNKLETLEYNLKTEELAHQATLKEWRKLQESLLHIKNVLEAAIARPNEIAVDWKEHLASFIIFPVLHILAFNVIEPFL